MDEGEKGCPGPTWGIQPHHTLGLWIWHAFSVTAEFLVKNMEQK